jgi:hypothetical protein
MVVAQQKNSGNARGRASDFDLMAKKIGKELEYTENICKFGTILLN